MNHLQLFHSTCAECSSLITRRYSTSFSLGIRLFDRRFQAPVCGIYGFVRFADEIVDTFHDYPKAALFERFRQDTWRAMEEGISLNPVLYPFFGNSTSTIPRADRTCRRLLKDTGMAASVLMKWATQIRTRCDQLIAQFSLIRHLPKQS